VFGAKKDDGKVIKFDESEVKLVRLNKGQKILP